MYNNHQVTHTLVSIAAIDGWSHTRKHKSSPAISIPALVHLCLLVSASACLYYISRQILRSPPLFSLSLNSNHKQGTSTAIRHLINWNMKRSHNMTDYNFQVSSLLLYTSLVFIDGLRSLILCSDLRKVRRKFSHFNLSYTRLFG